MARIKENLFDLMELSTMRQCSCGALITDEQDEMNEGHCDNCNVERHAVSGLYDDEGLIIREDDGFNFDFD